jgi:hypothetical protein
MRETSRISSTRWSWDRVLRSIASRARRWVSESTVLLRRTCTQPASAVRGDERVDAEIVERLVELGRTKCSTRSLEYDHLARERRYAVVDLPTRVADLCTHASPDELEREFVEISQPFRSVTAVTQMTTRGEKNQRPML